MVDRTLSLRSGRRKFLNRHLIILIYFKHKLLHIYYTKHKIEEYYTLKVLQYIKGVLGI